MLNPGQMIAHFRVERKLGAGGMGEVYLAMDQKLQRQVALKILSREYLGDKEWRQRLEREARTAAQISHPNVMAIYEIGFAAASVGGAELSYIVMENVSGEPLSQYVAGRQTDIATLVRLAEKIASGLAAAHKMNIVHRDIKADNILVTPEGEPKILDFGLAKPLDPLQLSDADGSKDTISQQLTQAGKIVGTVAYMSPEQARGEKVDTRSDIFSFGILLYRLVTGSLPFEGPSPVLTLAKILEARQEPPRAKNAKVPEALERIIDKCLQKDPNDRYQDTRDLVVDLRDMRRQFESGPTESVSAVRDAQKETERHVTFKLGWRPLALIAVVVLAVIALIKIPRDTSTPGLVSPLQAGENSLAILSFENKTGDPKLDWLETGLPEILLTDLSQTPSMTLVSRQRLIDYLNREKRGQEESYTHAEMLSAAKALGAVTLLSGSLFKLGDMIRIDARLEEVSTGKIILGTKVSGPDPFALVDSLTHKIAEGLHVSELMTSHVSVTKVTSTSPEAYQLYHEGMYNFGLELFEEAIEKFEKALKIDPAFALAYMRIGMANAFRGHPREGAQNFALALQYKDRLPLRERSLLDVYSGMWLEQKYDEAFVRLESHVQHYPDDKEARTVHAIVLFQIAQDTNAAMAHLDTALQMDPQFQLALSFYAAIFEKLGNLDEAIHYAGLIRRYHPESPQSFLRLADLYLQKGRMDEAFTAFQDALAQFPDNDEALLGLSDLYIRRRSFDESRKLLEQLAQAHGDDPYRMANYYRRMANLSYWSGQFKQGLAYRQRVFEQSRKTGDSTLVNNALRTLAESYEWFNMRDSSLYYSSKAYKWANPFQRLSYPIHMVAVNSGNEAEARPIFKESLTDFRSRMPKQLWPLADALELIFEAHCRTDTAALISALEQLAQAQNEEAGANVREAGYLKVLSGQYESGRQTLMKFVTGRHELTSGFEYPYSLYLLGVANEGLGNTAEAVRNYEEMLGYWRKPDIELKEIKDALARLARLRG
ncbi:MAG TPA: protein kinase [Candidatus Deferrimicrobium sp.]|nr:protein kinase [Candidatus Deferrimicrobium sp.]